MDDRPQLFPTLRTLTAGGLAAGKPATGDLASPIHMSATYLRDADNGYRSGHVYGRADNAGLHDVQALLAKLDHACEAMLFGSGTAAATALFVSLEPTRIVAPALMYRGLKTWLRDRAPRYGHDVRFVDMSDMEALDAALAQGETGFVWIETPSNPLWTVTDIAAVCERAHRAGALVCADATVATPVLTRALDFGADFVIHSATKYLNGHSDVMAGVASSARPSPLWSRARAVRDEHGAVPGPMDAWLLMRGLRTLDLRVKAQSASALVLAERLRNHPAVSAVLYPGLSEHPAHALAARQMRGGFGGMLSIRVEGGADAAVRAAANVRFWRRATSFGGIESLIEHRASIEGEGSPCPDDLLRLSVGLEDPDDLHYDLAQALDFDALNGSPAEEHWSDMASTNAVAVAIICKAPEAGRSKTRLSPPLHPDECAEASACFIRDLAETIAAVAAEDESAVPYAVYTPAGSEARLGELLPPGCNLLLQREGSFGERLEGGVADLIAAGHAGAILINSDSPTLPRAIVAAAVDAVRRGGDSVVLSPAHDGGYTLIGLSANHPELFEGIAWSTATVFAETLERARAIRLPVIEVDGWYDVDDATSFAMLEAELDGHPPPFPRPGTPLEAASHTRRFVAARRAAASAA